MKLIDCEEVMLYRGTVLRFKDEYEEYVDFMLCEYPCVDEKYCPVALYCVSGYDAGHIEYVFPSEAKFENNWKCISTEWLVKNWNKRVYSQCRVDKIEVII